MIRLDYIIVQDRFYTIKMQRLLNLEKELIAKERIDAQGLKLIIFGPNYKQRERGFQVMRDNNMLDHHHLTEANKQQIRLRTFHVVAKAYKYAQLNLDDIEQNPNKGSLFATSFPYYDLGMSVRGGVHTYLYAKSIFLLGTQKHRQLLERTISLKDYGCFALTQLTHGSNVKGILTEAHYDHTTREFIINSPNQNAMKFWIGGAAETANMSVVWAQLYINGKCHGVHAYVVPIRDPLTHKLLPGVLVGDCGPKSGLNGIDNGFLLFNKVRIPVGNQLDRISGVDEKGQFKTIIKNDQKRFGLHLAALSGGRYMIAVHCCTISLQSLTIAIRYCHERRQFKLPGKTQQTLLIDYPLTKRRLMPLLAQTIVYYMASMTNVFYWDENQKNIFDPTHPTIQNLHAISSVMKAMTSWFASECIRQCRQQMGAHGYSSYSKLGTLYNDNDINLTWQGDNHVLIQQTTKYIMQQAQKIMQKGQKTNNSLLQFLSNPPQTLPAITRENLLNLNKGVEFLQYKLAKKIEETGLKMFELQQQKLSLMEIWNGAQVFLGREVALAYGNLSILTTAIQAINKCNHKINKEVIQTSTILWMLIVYRKEQFVDLVHRPIIQRLITEQCSRLAPFDLDILSAISVDDDIIGSPFADPHGNGIQKYLKMMTSKPTNQRPQWWDIFASR